MGLSSSVYLKESLATALPESARPPPKILPKRGYPLKDSQPSLACWASKPNVRLRAKSGLARVEARENSCAVWGM
jgi:hypothetical protein